MKVAFDLRPLGAEYAGPRAIVEGWYKGWATAFPDDEVQLLGFDGTPTRVELFRGKIGMLPTPSNTWVLLASPTVGTALRGSNRRAIACHDFRHVEQPDRFSPLQRAFRRVVWERAFSQSKLVIANSEETRQEILRRLPHATVCVLSWAPSVTGVLLGGHRESRLGIIAVAHRTNKPPDRAVNAWLEAFPDAAKRPPLTVLAGDLASTVEPEPGLNVLERVSDAEYKRLIQTSIAAIYLSDFEGLGLPCFEAMAAGTPLVTSNLPIFRKNLGEDYCGFSNAKPHLVLRSFVENASAWSSCRAELLARGTEQDKILLEEFTSLRDDLLLVDKR